MAAVLLELGTRLLHIGPHKTGTTAIQGALHLARERLTAEGVVYPGRAGSGCGPSSLLPASPPCVAGRAPRSPTGTAWSVTSARPATSAWC